MPDIMNIGIIGAGTIARSHVKALNLIQDRATITAVCDINPETAKDLAPESGAKVFTSHREMLKLDDLDICLVCLPHSLHAPVGKDVLAAGKHLFLEKPMALNIMECRELIDAEKISGKTIFVGHTHQYKSSTRKAKELIEQGMIGKPSIIVSEVIAYYKWENRKPWFLDPAISGGGPLFNTTPHQADQLLYLAGSPAKSVRAQVSNLRPDAQIDSDLMAFVEFENQARGMICTFSGTKLEETGRVLCRVLGDGGSIQFNPFKNELELLKLDGKETITTDTADGIMLEWAEMLDSITNHRPSATGSIYGHNAVALLEAMTISSRENREVQPEFL